MTINNGAVFDDLHRLGYQTVAVSPGFEDVALRRADSFIDTGQLNEFESLTVQVSGLSAVADALVPNLAADQDRARILDAFRVAEAQAQGLGANRKLVFVHVVAPHSPPLFDAAGGPLDVTGFALAYRDVLEIAQYGFTGYVSRLEGELQFLDGRTLHAVDTIVEADPGAVVVVFSDHGSGAPSREPGATSTLPRLANGESPGSSIAWEVRDHRRAFDAREPPAPAAARLHGDRSCGRAGDDLRVDGRSSDIVLLRASGLTRRWRGRAASRCDHTAAMRILVTGAAGFICGYLVPELLEAGHEVVGLDNFSKYGPARRSYDDHPRYRLVEGDAKNVDLLRDLVRGCDQVLAAAAMIGGISYFHEFAYDLLAENERILASTFDAAIEAHRRGELKRIVVLSSSMVYESADVFPTPEGAQASSPPPVSTYGFQKLASEYFAKGAWEQYRLPYTILRPFNCVGIGERRAVRDTEVMSGNVKLALSHVVPDLVLKVLRGQDPLHILGEGDQVRCYTYGGDLAHGIRLAMESGAAINEDFNLSTPVSTTVLELAGAIWPKLNGEDRPFRYVSDPPFEHDVQHRVPDVRKAREVLGFEAATTLSGMLDEVIPWLRAEDAGGAL